jgi:alkylation response protein AidB-like acyl-CoA dehydrogenase
MIGRAGTAWDLLTHAVVKSRISAAAQGVGIARGAYAHGLVLLSALYGRILPQAVADRLADLRGRIVQGRLLLIATAAHVDATGDGPPPTASIAVMKQHCTDLGFAVTAAVVRLLAAFGDRTDLGVERYLRDAKVTQIYDGTNEIQRLLVARDTRHRTDRLTST